MYSTNLRLEMYKMWPSFVLVCIDLSNYITDFNRVLTIHGFFICTIYTYYCYIIFVPSQGGLIVVIVESMILLPTTDYINACITKLTGNDITYQYCSL